MEMGLAKLSANEVNALSVTALGLDGTALDLTSPEVIAEGLRRAASFRCPCTAATLVRSVVEPLRGLVSDLDATRDLVEKTLESVVAHGDILEERELDETSNSTSTLLYAAPPAFVMRQSGAVILIGIASSQDATLSEELAGRVEFTSHVRRLKPLPSENLSEELTELGLIEISYENWLKPPPSESVSKKIQQLNRVLDSAAPSRDIPGLLLLDPKRPVKYYPGRWVQPAMQSGRFVARRDQKYGAQLWGYVEMRDGSPEKFIDFPLPKSRWRGCDEAWHLQMAIDAEGGRPQQFKVIPGHRDGGIMQFFSPVPMWARRRWDATGELVDLVGCLFAYQFNNSEMAEEIRFVCESLWLKEFQ
jgi:hypothetical protein